MTEGLRARLSGRLICALLVFLMGTPTAFAASKAEEKAEQKAASEKQISQIRKEISQLDEWLKKANSEKSGLAAQLRKEEKAIDQVSRDIRANQERIGTLLKQLAQLEQDFKAQQLILRQQKDFYARQIRASYLQGQQPALKLMLNADSPQDAMRQMRYLGYLNQARSEKIETYQEALAQLKATEEQLLTQKTELAQEREALAESQKRLNASLAERKHVLARLDSNIKNEAARLSALKSDQTRLETLVKEIEQALAKIQRAQIQRPFGKQRAKLPWPTHGKVLTRFGAQTAQGKLRSNGIRFATDENAPVKAVHSGSVVFSDWLRGFGLLLIIDHGNGFMSLYGNNRSLLKHTGDTVQAQDVVAYASAGTTDIESGLYFEIRENGKPQDPLLWLK